MSYSSPGPTSLSTTAEIPRGEIIGRYDTYAHAQKAVDHLADQQFEVAKISIIGSDLKSVERVTGRLSYPRVALQGALNGVVFGAFFGLLMSLVGGADLASALLLPILLGGAFWMLMAIITYAMQRGKRDFTSVNRIVATSYQVIADPAVAGQARQVLGQLGLGGSAPRAASAPAPGPQQGARPQQGPPTPQNGPSDPASQGAPRPVGPSRSARFPDLPDGRPQYGVRVAPQGPPRVIGQQGQQGQANQPVQQTDRSDAAAAGSSSARAPWSNPGGDTDHHGGPHGDSRRD